MAQSNIIYPQFAWNGLTRRQQLSLMDEYYGNNDLYENTRILRHYLGVWNEDIRPLRSPVHRSVEFFTAKVAAGEPTISAYNKNQALHDAIEQIMDWSNFQVMKPLHVRNMAKYGDLFRKVVSESGKVWHEMVDTADVQDFKEDARGFLTEIRIDTPFKDLGRNMTRTEFWTVNDAIPYMAIWEHSLSEDATLEQIQRSGDPIEYHPLSDFGIDFVPFVRSTFSDNGQKWGINCVEHALLKVDEANRQATNLHQTLFRYGKVKWLVSANQVNDDGSPVASPDVSNIEMRDNDIMAVGGKTTVDALVPNIDYQAALNVLLSQEHELEKDLPELAYYSLPDKGVDPSGKALRTILGAAIDRANQAQASFVEGTIRLNQMAITVGEFQNIFQSLGTFDDGSLAHSIMFKDAFPVDISEMATTLQSLVTAGIPLAIAMGMCGFSQEAIDQVAPATVS